MQTYPIPMVPGPVAVPEAVRQVYLGDIGFDISSRNQDGVIFGGIGKALIDRIERMIHASVFNTTDICLIDINDRHIRFVRETRSSQRFVSIDVAIVIAVCIEWIRI